MDKDAEIKRLKAKNARLQAEIDALVHDIERHIKIASIEGTMRIAAENKLESLRKEIQWRPAPPDQLLSDQEPESDPPPAAAREGD